MIEYTPTFTIGYNTPGYLPEMDTYVVEGVELARAAMLHELERWADDVSGNDQGLLLEEIEAVIQELDRADVSKGWDAFISDPDREHDLGTHYWITPGGVVEEEA